MSSVIISVLCLFLVLSNASRNNNRLIRRLLDEYDGESIVIAVSNSDMLTRSQCKSVYETQKDNGYTFEEEWEYNDKMYYCIFSEDDEASNSSPQWKTESNSIVYYDSERRNSVRSIATYSYTGFIHYYKELNKIYGMQQNMDSNVFSIDFIRDSNSEVITSVNYKILQPKSEVLNIVLLRDEPSSFSDCGSGDIIDEMTNVDVIYVCSQYQWNLIGGSNRMELIANGNVLDISSVRPKSELTRVSRQYYDYMSLSIANLFDALGDFDVISFTVNAFIENDSETIDNLELANDQMSQDFSFQYTILTNDYF
jgi:hypothetical protein